MRKGLMFTIPMCLLFIIIGFGCSDTHQETTMNVSGSWSGHLSADGRGVISTASSLYRLILSKNGEELSGEFNFPEDDAKPIFMLSGTDAPDGISLTGSNGQETLSLSGQMGDNDSLQILLETSDGQKNHILFFRDKQPAPSKYINTYKFEKKCGAGSPVILIHGMDDDASTWDEMIERFRNDGICDKHSVYTYQYDWIVSIYDNGLQLGIKILEQNFPEHPIIVAHSMGGLVSRAHIAQGGNVEALITLGTPHRGSPLADLTYIFPWATGTGVGDLRPDSPFIIFLTNSTLDYISRPKYHLLNGRVDVHWECTKEVMGVCVWGKYVWNRDDYPSQIKAGWAALRSLGHNDGMVPEWSARFDGDFLVNRYDTCYWYDHIALNKPSKAPEVYKYIRDFLNRQ